MSLWDEPGVAAYIEDYWDSLSEAAMRQAVADWVGPQFNRRLLDVGCGSARMSSLLRGGTYDGVDGSHAMLELARKRAPHALFKQADILADPLPYADKSYDTALCMHVMRHMPGYEKLLLELERVAREQVFVVDVFHSGGSHIFGSTEVAEQVFEENIWSLPLFLDDVAKASLGWKASVADCAGVTGVKIEIS